MTEGPSARSASARADRRRRLHELGGEPIEQLRMGRRTTAAAEIGGRRNEPASEMAEPDVVDRDPRGEGVARRREPPGEGGSASGAGRGIGLDGTRLERGVERLGERFDRGGELLLGFGKLLLRLVGLVGRGGGERGPGLVLFQLRLGDGGVPLEQDGVGGGRGDEADRGGRGGLRLPTSAATCVRARLRIDRRQQRGVLLLSELEREVGFADLGGDGVGRALRFGESGLRLDDGLLAGGDGVAEDGIAAVGVGGEPRQLHLVDLEPAPESGGDTGLDDFVGERMPFVAADQEVRRRIGGIEGADQAVFRGVQLAGQAVGADVVRLEDGPQRVVLALRDGIVHVVVAFRTPHREPEEGLRGVLHGVLQPLLAGEHLVVADEEAGGAQGVGILWSDLVRREHLGDHAVVRFVRVERADDPIAPTPDVGLRVAHLVAVGPAGPIAVAPHVHPVPRPALAMARIGEQAVHQPLVSAGRGVVEERLLLGRCRVQPDQVEVHPAQEDLLRCLRPRFEPASTARDGKEGVDGVSGDGGRGDGRTRDRFERLPPVAREELGEIRRTRRRRGELGRGRHIFRAAGIVAEQELRLVVDTVGVRVLFRDGGEPGREVLRLARGGEVVTELAEAHAERIVGELVEGLRELLVARQMAGRAAGQRLGQEPVVMLLQRGAVGRRRLEREHEAKRGTGQQPPAGRTVLMAKVHGDVGNLRPDPASDQARKAGGWSGVGGWGLAFRVSGLGSRVSGLGFQVSGFRARRPRSWAAMRNLSNAVRCPRHRAVRRTPRNGSARRRVGPA